MAIRIKARNGESAEQMLRRFKKLCEKEGLTKEIKKRAYYEKPSERKQRAMRKSVKVTTSRPVPHDASKRPYNRSTAKPTD
jgi:small subunit ribosomal protein S21